MAIFYGDMEVVHALSPLFAPVKRAKHSISIKDSVMH